MENDPAARGFWGALEVIIYLCWIPCIDYAPGLPMFYIPEMQIALYSTSYITNQPFSYWD